MTIENKKKLYYVIFREDIEGNLIKSQVLDLLDELNGEYEFISLIFIRRIFQKMNDVCRRTKIEKFTCLIGKLPPGIFGSLMLVLQSLLIGVFYFLRPRFFKSIFVCRSYNAALFFFLISLITQSKYIIDTRSPFLKEKLVSGGMNKGSLKHVFWQWLHGFLNDHAYKVIAISEAHKTSIEEESGIGTDVTFVYNSLPKSFTPKVFTADDEIKADKLKLCYLGSFGHWNSSNNYFSFLDSLKKSKVDFSITFFTSKAHHDGLYKLFDGFEIDCQQIDQSSVQDHLALFDFGLYFLTEIDERIGVKTIEYLSSGLPIIHNGQIKGLRELQPEFPEAFYSVDDILTNKFSLPLIRSHQFRSHLSGKAFSKFSVPSVAKMYSQILC